ncbi:MAG TPA: SurA N-terminal domain-containing protein [Pyrinomonadaceae bacterium]|nr:SurA N-terminal domain-containing protein [Pyrinomonadaceae bacterium]
MQRKLTTLISLAAIVSIAVLLTACGAGTETPDNTVAATVNGKKIMMSEVERVIHQQAQGKESQMSAHDLAQARLTVLDKLIQREVMFQRAEQEKLLPSEEDITNELNKQKQQSGMTDEEFARQLKEQNMSMEALREETKKDLAINRLQDKYAGKVTISDREVEDYYNANKGQFVNSRGVGLAMIMVDPADNSAQGVTDDAKNDADAKTKIDNLNAQLKSGADFATVARAKSEDANSVSRGGDIGFATEDDLKQNGFPPDLVGRFFGAMQVGDRTDPIRFPSGKWYIFKLQEKRLTTENLTLESQGVRQQITVALTNQRKEILNAALVEVSQSEAKIVNSFAANILSNPGNLGLRPASSEAAKPASSPAAATNSPAASSSPAAAKSGSLPAASPTAKK